MDSNNVDQEHCMEEGALKSKNEDLLKEVNNALHLLPCKIDYRGEAKTEKYFAPFIRKEGDDELKCSFRGYPLLGKEIELPSDTVGILFSDREEEEGKEKQLQEVGSFKKLTYWNWDQVPSSDDPVQSAFDWMKLAKVIHSE